MILSTVVVIACAVLLGTSVMVTVLFMGVVTLLSLVFELKEHGLKRVFDFLSITVTLLLLLFVAVLLLKGIILTVAYCIHQWGIV